MKLSKNNIFLIIGYILILVVIGYNSPKEINWTPTYSMEHTVPYGCKVLYNQLGDILGADIEKSKNELYNLEELDGKSNLIYITTSFAPDDNDIDRLMYEVRNGATVFLATEVIGQKLQDSLHMNTGFTNDYFGIPGVDSSQYFAARYIGSNKTYKIKHPGSMPYITPDSVALQDTSLEYTPLCTAMSDRTIMASIKIGEGKFIVQSFPRTFTNYNMLKKPNDEFVAGALSFLPVQHTIWDEYYKPLRNEKADTPLRYILSAPALKWAYYVSIAFLLLYIIFSSKRMQRIIPTMQPPVNQSLEFTRTVGSLYFNSTSDHRDIAMKKMVYFLERIRLHYNMATPYNDDEFQEKLAAKSGVAIEVIADIFAQYNFINKSISSNENQLQELTKAIENFYLIANISYK